MKKSCSPLATHLLDILVRAGWDSHAEAISLHLQTPDSSESQAKVFSFERGGERLALVDFASASLLPNPQETIDSLFERYLDLSLNERIALWSVAPLCNPNLLICLTPEGGSLLDARDELTLSRFTPENQNSGIETMARVLEEHDPARRVRPDATRLSKDLVRWSDLFAGSMGPALKWARPDARRLSRQLFLGLKSLLSARASQLKENFVHLGLTVADGKRWKIAYNPPPPPEFADLLLQEAAKIAPQATGAFSQIERGALLRQLHDLPPARQSLLTEVTRLASAKLQAAIQLSTLVPLEQEPESWRLALLEPLRVQEEIASTDFYVFEPLELDLSQCGFGRVLEAIEKLALYAISQNNQIRQAGGRQIDLLEPEPEGLDARQTLADPFDWVFHHALRLRVAPAYRETVAYLAASHVVDLRTRKEFADCPPTPLTSLPYLFAS